LNQARRRETETAAKQQALQHVRFTVIEGGRKDAIAEALGISARTIRDWEKRHRDGDLEPKRRGRPLKRSSVQRRNELLATIETEGPQIGLETLRRRYPDMAKGEIRDLLRRYREHYIRLHDRMLRYLEWTEPGLVWAMDHTVPPSAVDAKDRCVLSLRDLASGAQLLWKEELGQNAEEVVRDLEGEFLAHGAPLVLKVDNGPAFISQKLRDLCQRWGVELLWSPPWTPRYNGAIESTIRWMKDRTEHAALRAGRPGEWRAEDLQVAKANTNQLPKDPRQSATPRIDVFAARLAVSIELRSAFRSRLAQERALERQARGIAANTTLRRREETSINRQAMRRALVALGILNITVRRVPLTLKSILAAKIS
jgi:transposase